MNGRPPFALRCWIPLAGLALGLTACATPPSAPAPPAPPPPPPKASTPADPSMPSSPAPADPAAPSSPAAPAGEARAASPPAAEPGSDTPPSPAAGADTASGAGPVADAALSPEERLAQLDQDFSESLGAFDERLAREQVAVRQQQEAAAADRAARNAGRGAGGDGEPGMGAAWPPPPGTQGEDAPPDTGPGGSRRGQPSPGNRSGLPVPQDVADASGDDIVARQLREAAMAETDPELAKKLWDEYRDYKRKQR